MCHEIPADNFIANCFFRIKENTLSLKELNLAKEQVEAVVHSIHVNISTDSLCEATQSRGAISRWSGDLIHLRSEQNIRTVEDAAMRLNSLLPEKVATEYIKAFAALK